MALRRLFAMKERATRISDDKSRICMKEKFRLIRNDIILAIFAVVLSLGAYFVSDIFSHGGGDAVSVTLDGKEIMTFSLSEDGTYIVEECDYSFSVKDGVVRVTETHCKDRSCELMTVDRDGGEIICLPNKLVIRHKTQKETPADIIAG